MFTDHNSKMSSISVDDPFRTIFMNPGGTTVHSPTPLLKLDHDMRWVQDEFETNSNSSDQVVLHQKQGVAMKADHEVMRSFESYLVQNQLRDPNLYSSKPKHKTPFFFRLEELNEKIKVFNSLFYNKVPKYE